MFPRRGEGGKHLNPTVTAEKAKNQCLLKVFHAYAMHTSTQKSKFQAFIAEIASANKVLMVKSCWNAVALKAISESTEQ